MYAKIVTNNVIVPNKVLLIAICAITMGLGVLVGGKRIVTTVGEKMVRLNHQDALCTDISTIFTLVLASFLGMPVSTTHVKTVSIISLPSAKEWNKTKFLEMVRAWVLTFPVCMLIAYILMRFLLG